MLNRLLVVALSLISFKALADSKESPPMQGVLVDSIFQVSSFTIAAGTLDDCATRPVSADMTLYSCSTTLPFVADTPSGTQYIVFDRVIFVDSSSGREFQFFGSWRSAPNSILTAEPIILILFRKVGSDILVGNLEFVDLKYKLAVKATFVH